MVRWREYSPGMKMLAVPIGLSMGIFAISIVTVRSIETSALYQPTTADPVFRHPHDIKGRIRYLTDQQERIHAMANPAMFGSLAVGMALGYAFNVMHARRERDKKRRAMDRIARGLQEVIPDSDSVL